MGLSETCDCARRAAAWRLRSTHRRLQASRPAGTDRGPSSVQGSAGRACLRADTERTPPVRALLILQPPASRVTTRSPRALVLRPQPEATIKLSPQLTFYP